MQSNDAAERLLHHDDITTRRKLSNFKIHSIKMEAYVAAILNSIKDGQDIKQVPPSCIFLIGLRKRAENWMSSEHL